ncbi:GCG_CRPN prefix-to-repeats domain-containing protein [Roseixanthobacter liquoris]|uniref:GCG_CRPN prefix-to-repeats domain-containing protein n=1 Tax=Roseixanthobacter liquoris TaxID=3119921 RepID=UPI0037262409
MRKALFAAALALCCASVEAEAFPAQPSQPGPNTVITVAQGCGVGWHRGPYGGCRPNAVRRCWWRATPWGPRRVCNW